VHLPSVHSGSTDMYAQDQNPPCRYVAKITKLYSMTYIDGLQLLYINKAECVKDIKVLRPNTIISSLGRSLQDRKYNSVLNSETRFSRT
jgi:hypothetical protein